MKGEQLSSGRIYAKRRKSQPPSKAAEQNPRLSLGFGVLAQASSLRERLSLTPSATKVVILCIWARTEPYIHRRNTMRRVVITGIGIISPLGLTRTTTWEGLLEGRSGVNTLNGFDTAGLDTTIGAEVKGFDPI